MESNRQGVVVGGQNINNLWHHTLKHQWNRYKRCKAGDWEQSVQHVNKRQTDEADGSVMVI